MNALEYRNPEGALVLASPVINKGEDAQKSIREFFRNVRSPTLAFSPRLPALANVANNAHGLEEKLYESRAAFKVYASQVSMHLGRDWLAKLFAQIDSTLDVEEWDPRDPPPQLTTAQTFIRMLLILKVNRKPGMGVSNAGNFVAAWTDGNDRLTVECFADDRVRWVLSRKIGAEVERAAGEGKIDRLKDFLAPYKPDIWFEYAK